MTDPDDARCPGCGADAASRYCPHCGARTGWADLVPPVLPSGPVNPPTSDAPTMLTSAPSAPAGIQSAPVQPPTVDADAPTLPAMPAVPRPMPPRAVPEMFSTQFLPVAGPVRAWSAAVDPGDAPANPPPGLFPGRTGMQTAVPTPGAAEVLPPRPERRRKAIYAVLGIAAATVIVLLTALLLAPNWRGTAGTAGTVAGKVAQGPAVTDSSARTTATAPPTPTAGTPTAGTPTAGTPTAGTPTATPGGAGTRTGLPSSAGGVPPVRTVTVTPPTGRTTAPTPRSTPKPSTPRSAATSTATPTLRSTPKPSTTAPALPLGVPQRDIACSAGYIVQLASELDEPRFKARVAALQSAGRMPAGALAADSTRSCRIFTSQVNTLVLYSGPYPSKYDGCAARLAGPADAYIKGGNADSAGEYVSCLCPAPVAGLPGYSAVGEQGVWVGELQRVLGNRLNIDVSDLAGNWGRFTAGTQAAVREFQRAAKLPSNGVVDALTWSALQSAEC